MSVDRASIVLLTKNSGELFDDVLRGLLACTDIDHAEILMIDSGSTDGTIRRAEQFPQIHVHPILPQEFGHGKTRNVGARLTRRPYIVFLVHDATPVFPDFLHRLLKPLEDPVVAGVFGRQMARDSASPIERYYLESTYPDRPRRMQRSKPGVPRIEDVFFSNVCSAVRREVLERIPFDESLIMSEDQQWSRQVQEAGHHLVYEPRALVRHSHDYGPTQVFKRNFDSGASLVGITHNPLVDMAAYEVRYLFDGVRGLLKRREGRWIPRFFGNEAARALGMSLGRQAPRLPNRINRKLSLHAYHWGSSASG